MGYRTVQYYKKSQLTFLKSILQCPKNTPYYIVRLESEVSHVAIHIWKRVLNYLKKILNMYHKTTLSKLLYNRLLYFTNSSTNTTETYWTSQIKSFLSNFGYSYIWETQQIHNNKIKEIISAFQTIPPLTSTTNF